MGKRMKNVTNKKLKEEHPILASRSVFSTMKITGGGIHKSAKDYDRKNGKKEVRRYLEGKY